MSGFGGQGIMMMGQLISQAGMDDGHQVSWLPSYGPEMRGGTANCSVIVSSADIPSPVIDHDATSVIIMNRPSLPKFLPHVQPGGCVLVNSSLVPDTVDRDDVKVVYVPSNEIANELGNLKMTNMVMLGAFIAATRCVSPEALLHSLEVKLGARKAHLMEGNRLAFDRGADCVTSPALT
ncbi:2-oxoacid:acceptor oxidoreductase family protein [Austwickia sp. TVS 96-490-7B]|uniref:2-oxoacid:acceptor oxidoreductase family protein n=1 Tax=Austwickia sp. TVS 96-490-7B TaxID=2830843 RepID=UPI001C58A96C|nr:2-oxoacid:acceptor oxidoreductase family protein [Austwickia sp. TVS 96-490-7B]